MKIRNFDKCGSRNVNISTLIVAVDSLTAGQNLPHLRLGQIPVLSQVSNPAIIRHTHTTLFRINIVYLRKFFAIDF